MVGKSYMKKFLLTDSAIKELKETSFYSLSAAFYDPKFFYLDEVTMDTQQASKVMSKRYKFLTVDNFIPVLFKKCVLKPSNYDLYAIEKAKIFYLDKNDVIKAMKNMERHDATFCVNAEQEDLFNIYKKVLPEDYFPPLDFCYITNDDGDVIVHLLESLEDLNAALDLNVKIVIFTNFHQVRHLEMKENRGNNATLNNSPVKPVTEGYVLLNDDKHLKNKSKSCWATLFCCFQQNLPPHENVGSEMSQTKRNTFIQTG
jgi:hypothetical protein